MIRQSNSLATHKVLAVDVRGTLIDPHEDKIMNPELATSLWRFVRVGGVVGIVTATSLKSLEMLVIPQLISSLKNVNDNSHLLSRFFLYVDSGTAAYMLGIQGRPIELSDYQFVSFSHTQVNQVIEMIKLSCRTFPWSRAVWKIKPGQINYYCGGTFEERIELAEFLRVRLATHAEDEIFVMVPSVKSTIDIALRNKSYATRDLLSRSKGDLRSLIILGDSLQAGGADYDMWSVAPTAVAIQVGPHKPSLEVRHLPEYGPQAALSILREILNERTSRE